MNAVILCAGCHIYKKPQDPIGWYEVVREYVGVEVIETLQIMSNSTEKTDLETVYSYLQGYERDKPWLN